MRSYSNHAGRNGFPLRELGARRWELGDGMVESLGRTSNFHLPENVRRSTFAAEGHTESAGPGVRPYLTLIVLFLFGFGSLSGIAVESTNTNPLISGTATNTAATPVKPSDGPAVRQSGSPTVRPPDRPTSTPSSTPPLQIRDPLNPWPRDPLVQTAQPKLDDPNQLLESGVPAQSGAQLPLRDPQPQASTRDGGAGAKSHSEAASSDSQAVGQSGDQAVRQLDNPTAQTISHLPSPISPAANPQSAMEEFAIRNPQSTSPPAPTPSSQLLAPTTPLDAKHKLAIGDRLSFRILEDQEDPTEPRDPKPLTVADSGELEIPYIGRFPAENKTCKELAAELKAALEKDYYFQATVILAVDLMAKTRGKVYLVGPVRVPGALDIPTDEVLTLSKAIMRAGGFSDFADKRNVKVTRKGSGAGADAEKRTFVVDVGEILEKGKVERDLPLEPGDFVLIPERAIRF